MWSRWWRRPPAPSPLDERLWRDVAARVPQFQGLPSPEALRLRALSAHFLTRKAITPVQSLQLDATERALVAALCCLPVLHLGGQWLAGWHEVVIYPGAFRVRRSELDEPTGVLHEWDEDLAGEAWSEGPLILSWEDLLLDLEEPEAGCQVVAHEIAHKLDLRDGVLDGTPPLPADRLGAWVRDFQAAFDALVEDVEAERETAIDPYAASAPEEFFAVVSEYHFAAPEIIEDAMPAIAAQLRGFYGPSPMSRN